MTPTSPIVAEKARARRIRTRSLRRRIAAGAASVFIALFATISIQMATGNDPALGTTKRTAPAASAPATAHASSSTTRTSRATSGSSSGASTPATVTTQQS